MSNDVERTETGQFAKGVSGNPAGRPKGSKNEITKLKLQLEELARQHISPQKIVKVFDKMVDLALKGHVGAGKLVLDKTLSNARETEELDQTGQSFVFKVKNLTLKASPGEPPQVSTADVIEADYVELTPTGDPE